MYYAQETFCKDKMLFEQDFFKGRLRLTKRESLRHLTFDLF